MFGIGSKIFYTGSRFIGNVSRNNEFGEIINITKTLIEVKLETNIVLFIPLSNFSKEYTIEENKWMLEETYLDYQAKRTWEKISDYLDSKKKGK